MNAYLMHFECILNAFLIPNECLYECIINCVCLINAKCVRIECLLSAYSMPAVCVLNADNTACMLHAYGVPIFRAYCMQIACLMNAITRH